MVCQDEVCSLPQWGYNTTKFQNFMTPDKFVIRSCQGPIGPMTRGVSSHMMTTTHTSLHKEIQACSCTEPNKGVDHRWSRTRMLASPTKQSIHVEGGTSFLRSSKYGLKKTQKKQGCLSASKPRVLIIQVYLHLFAIQIYNSSITNKV